MVCTDQKEWGETGLGATRDFFSEEKGGVWDKRQAQKNGIFNDINNNTDDDDDDNDDKHRRLRIDRP